MRTTETDIRTMAFTLSSIWMCLCFLSLLALLLSLSLCQPFGIHRLSLHNTLFDVKKFKTEFGNIFKIKNLKKLKKIFNIKIY
jgi:hypothetical protein